LQQFSFFLKYIYATVAVLLLKFVFIVPIYVTMFTIDRLRMRG